MSTKEKGQKVFATDEEVIQIRNRRNRLRPAKVVTSPDGSVGRPQNLIPNRRTSKEYRNLMAYFIMPLVNAMDLGDDPTEKMSFQDRIAFLLGEKHRDIVMAVATQDFKVQGLYWRDETPGDMIPPETINARILRGAPLMVRIDERMPDRIDIERCDVEEPAVYTLTRLQYTNILPFLKEITGCNERLDPPGVLAVNSTR